MVNEPESKQLPLSEADRLRQQAGQLLDRLLADREQSERRQAEAGKRDPMKFITGRTAIDQAIASVRDMVSNMDNLLARANDEIGQSAGPARPQIHTVSRSPSRKSIRSTRPLTVVAARESQPVHELQ